MNLVRIQHPVRAVPQGGTEEQHQEDSRSGLPSVSGRRNTVEGGIGAFLLVKAAGLGTMN